MDALTQSRVGVFRGAPDYRQIGPALRGALELAGLRGVNPLCDLIKPGDCVLLKPNLIRQGHATRPSEWEQVITHGAVIHAVANMAADALQGKGKIIIADGPQTDSDFDEICKRVGLFQIRRELQDAGVTCDVFDLRRERWLQEGDVIHERKALPGDPLGYTTVDLNEASEFSTFKLGGSFYGADYDTKDTAQFHSNGSHRYILCRSVMDADVVINLPKMKTHKKTGVTLSLKNMVGINGYRNCLPHFTIGTPSEGGDEFPESNLRSRVQSRAIVGFKRALVARKGTAGSAARIVKRVGRVVFGDTNEVVRSGNWHGNDTAWRMVLDLNKALFYFDGEAHPRSNPLRYLTIVDGVIAGHGNGPMAPDPVPAGVLVAGMNPVAADVACTLLMGFDDSKVPLLAGAWKAHGFPLACFPREAVSCASNYSPWNGSLVALMSAPHLGFKPHFGWESHIERKEVIPLSAQ
jgi:uncharacterized protein (DUF362 family)